jgi:RHS repeat-associated protein
LTQSNGNVLSQTITVPTVGQTDGFVATQSFEYDTLNRLQSAEEIIDSQTSWKQVFTFDRYGNRNFDEANTTFAGFEKLCNNNTELCAELRRILNPSINQSNNRLSSSDDYVFDSSGNTTEDAQGRTFIYDAENKQIEVQDSRQNVIGQYHYDGDGKRVKKYVPDTGEVTVFVYSAGGQLVAEYSTAISQDPKVSYTTADHLGSPRILTDENGATISRRDFHPFGEEISTPERTAALGYQPDDVRQKFTGYERDTETDLDFAQARMYARQLGRFTGSDALMSSGKPSSPQSWNRYGYTLNNPLILVDPSGLYVCKAEKQECEQFEAALQKGKDSLKKIEEKYGKDSKQYKKAERAFGVYGKAGEKNGVFIFSKEGNGVGRTSVSGIAGAKTGENPTGQTINVTFDPDLFEDDYFAQAIIHEGSHAADGSDWVKSGFKDSMNPSWFKLEYDAYYLDSVLAEAEGVISMSLRTTMEYGLKKPYKTFRFNTTIWSKSWAAVDVETLRQTNIEFHLRHDKLYELTPASKEPAFFKGARPK